MFGSWKFIFLVVVSMIFLSACGQSLEERATKGVKTAEEVFFENATEDNLEVDGVKLFKPTNFTVKDSSDAQNIIFNTKKETFILFNNPNEGTDSRLFYDLLIADQNKNIVAEKTLIEDDTFGFVAVVESDNDTYELIVSVGGAKITTLTSEKEIESNLSVMMKIVRSIKQEL